MVGRWVNFVKQDLTFFVSWTGPCLWNIKRGPLWTTVITNGHSTNYFSNWVWHFWPPWKLQTTLWTKLLWTTLYFHTLQLNTHSIRSELWHCLGVRSREFSHRIKSISMAKFTAAEVSALQAGGNEVNCSEVLNYMLIFCGGFGNCTLQV